MRSSWSRRSRPISRRIRDLSPARRRQARDGPDHRADHRDHAGAAVGVRAGGVHPGHLGPAVPAVRGGGGGLDGDLGDQRADAWRRRCARCCCGTITGRSAARSATCWVRIDWARDGYAAVVARLVRIAVFGLVVIAGVIALNGVAVQGHPDRLPAGGGSGRLLRRGAAARGRLGQPHRRGGRADRRHPEATFPASPTSARSSATARSTGSANRTAPTSSSCSSRSRSAPVEGEDVNSIIAKVRAARCGDPRGQRRRLQRAADHRAGYRRRLRIPAARPAWRRSRRSRRGRARADLRRQPGPELSGGVHDLLAPARRSSTSISTATRCRRSASACRRRVQRAAGDARRLLHQRLQSVRPHLAGQHAGRGRTTATRSTTSTGSTSAT